MTEFNLPPGPSAPRAVQGAYALAFSNRGMRRMHERYGDAFTVNVPILGRNVVISRPDEVKQLFLTSPDLVGTPAANLGRVLGPSSLFALNGDEHRRRRKLLTPPFHGRRLAAYERIVEEETAREVAAWPHGRPFATMPSMMRITLNVILRAVFGAEGEEFTTLRDKMPKGIILGSRLAVMPVPQVDWGQRSPWGRFWALRREYDAIVDRLIAKAAADPDLDGRDDILALMMQSRYEDGSPMTRDDIADTLITVLAAGHETTATTMAWAVERLRRHPEVLAGLVEEVDAGESTLREATILEVMRTRSVIDFVGRQVRADSLQLGRWIVPRGYGVLVSIRLLHEDEAVFPNAAAFDPSRFLHAKPDLYQWIPFGGGTRRCIGGAFATMEMNVILRTILGMVTLLPTTERDERWHSRGIAEAPAKGGRAVVHRRSSPLGRLTAPARQSTETGR
ncbi:cytochrome P450 [Streptomyces dysideae]|uniref:Cytochrome P450 n=1 Tax=Streptomyces dysideae TaxID=909626 RepID=A0A101UTA5_9ACTN|nr:cytochrome P450 [Streptomyces dysideae]KUO16480.1 cytochrome P450 [Streptomyces dysideae]